MILVTHAPRKLPERSLRVIATRIIVLRAAYIYREHSVADNCVSHGQAYETMIFWEKVQQTTLAPYLKGRRKFDRRVIAPARRAHDRRVLAGEVTFQTFH